MNLSFIKLDINILNDQKIKLIRKYPDGDKLFLLWVGLLCMAMKSDNPGYIYITNEIPYTDEDLASVLDLEIKTIQMGLELFKKYKMIETINGGIIEIINFNRHQQLDKIDRARQISRESSQRFRDKQKLLLCDGHVTESDETDKDKELDKDKEYKYKIKDVNNIYSQYPSRCVISGRSTGKCHKNKDKIRSLLKQKTPEEIETAITWYISDCKKTSTFMKNFSTFLNNIPDIEVDTVDRNKEYEEYKRRQEEIERIDNIMKVVRR